MHSMRDQKVVKFNLFVPQIAVYMKDKSQGTQTHIREEHDFK